MNNNVRIPVKPLPMEHIQLAENRELICDYANAKLYIKYDDKLVDITQELGKHLIEEGMPIGKCTLEVEGLGTVDLSYAIDHIISNLMKITDVGNQETQIISGFNIDYGSITNKNKKLQIVGFDSAPNGTSPYKINGSLVWATSASAAGETNVYDVVPKENSLQLSANSVQHTSNLDSNLDLKVSMPIVSTKYFKIRWRLDTNDNETTLSFPSNIGWEYDDSEIVEINSIYIFEFETWDFGSTWLGRVTKYNQPTVSEVLLDNIRESVYTKEETEALLSWINS